MERGLRGSGLPQLAALVMLLLTLVAARAQASIIYVVPGGNCGCTSACYAHPGNAVTAASVGDIIKVTAGTYIGGLQAHVACMAKTVVIRGGRPTTDWTAYNAEANRTTLDGDRQRRVLYVDGYRGVLALPLRACA